MVENGQQLLVSGSILHIARIDESVVPAVVGPPRDVGTIEVLNPALASTTIQLFDARGGRRSKIAERAIDIAETAEILCSNMSLENLVYTFGADAVQTYSQSATPLVGVNHYVYPDSILHLHDNSGNYLYNIASIQSIGTLVAGTDYLVTPEGLKMGFVKMLPAAAIAAGGATLAVSFTPTAVTSAARWFAPQTSVSAKVEAWIYWTADDYGTLQLRDHVKATITPANPDFKSTDFSQMRFTLAIVSDLTNTTRPAGRFVQPIGALPPRTF
jgi:hypothetical protein